MGKKEQIEKRLKYQNPNRDHIFVCFMKPDKYTKRLDFIMRRHHVWLDYQRLEVSTEQAMEHQMEYADLMEYVTKKYMKKLKEKGYNETRGDSTGAIITSSRKPVLVFSVGAFKKKVSYEVKK